VGLIGLGIVALGLVLVPFPGPGWLIVILGLAILASEFEAANRLLGFVRGKVAAWTHWIVGQPWPVRIAVGLATALFVLGVIYLTLVLTGVPGWVPDAWVPPLPGL